MCSKFLLYKYTLVSSTSNRAHTRMPRSLSLSLVTTLLSPLSKPPRVPLSRLESSSSTPRRSLLLRLLFPSGRTTKSFCSKKKKKKKNTTRQSSPRRIKRSSKRGFCRLSGGVYIFPTTNFEKKRKGRRKRTSPSLSFPAFPAQICSIFSQFRVARELTSNRAPGDRKTHARAHASATHPLRESCR